MRGSYDDLCRMMELRRQAKKAFMLSDSSRRIAKALRRRAAPVIGEYLVGYVVFFQFKKKEHGAYDATYGHLPHESFSKSMFGCVRGNTRLHSGRSVEASNRCGVGPLVSTHMDRILPGQQRQERDKIHGQMMDTERQGANDSKL